ncbi:unnamed protein product [Microthlaspi erraticum]|uniref:RING-type domain-containing protein n=1 Tax=Microthlaspi erraticum TaxID=1685480 RepID=A0A6D2J415_9BRAS|nr:unnamed protein product [Microthlaspi erraticum]
MSDYGEKTCPLCAEKMDLTDQQLKPCQCGYQICVWCWHHIVDMAEKDQTEGRCPACRTPYDKEKIVGMTVDFDSLASEGNIERKKVQKSKSKPSEGQRELTSVRVIRRNLVYVVGLPINLADEDLLYHKEYFGQYGKVLKVSMSRTASGVIQQFPNSTCSVYITYAKEEEAVRCIQAVHGFILDGKALKACFGTTKYCHAWLRNAACVNPDCLYLHEVGSQEDSFTKDEVISAYTRIRVQQVTGATNIMQHHSGSMLPPPLDAYCDNSSTKPIVKVPSTNAASVPRYSPPSGSGSSSRSTALPAASSWGTQIANQQSLASSVTSNGSSDIQRSTSVNGTLLFSAVVANAAHGPLSSSDILKRPSLKDERQTVADKSKPNVLKPLQHSVEVDSGSKKTISSDRDSTSNWLSSSTDSSYDGRGTDNASATVNSFDDSNEAVEDVPTVTNLSVGVSRMGMTTNSIDERPDIPMEISGQCDQGSIRQPGPEVSKLPHLEQFRMDSSIETDKKAVPSDNGLPCTRPEWDWRSDLQSQMQASSKLEVENVSSFDSQRKHPEEDIIRSRFLSNSSSSMLDSNNMTSRSPLPFEISGLNDSHSRFALDRGNDRLHVPNGFGEKTMSNVEHSLFANEGRNKVSNSEDAIISNILSLDFDPWDEALISPHNLPQFLGEVDQRSSTLKPSNLLKQHNGQSRFSFARYEESSNQTSGSENLFGQLPRGKPIQESVASRDIYQDNLGSLNGFASNYSGGWENYASSPLFSSYKNPVSRPQVSAPPGFSAPSRLPPPGFSSHDRVGQSADTASGSRFPDSTSLLRNAYQVQPPVVSNSEDAIISNILSLDFDPWDEALISPHNLPQFLGEVDQRSSTLKPSNLLKQHNGQSRFSFARYEESSNQTSGSENLFGQLPRGKPIQESVASRDIYQDNLGSLNGFASNYSGGWENYASSPLFSSYKNPVSRPQVSAPPGFSAPSRLPPPGFSSHDRVGQSADTASGSRFPDSTSLLRNAYQVQPPVGNPNGANDLEFVDPAILAVGRGMVNADLDMRSGFSSQMNSFGNETGRQMLRHQSLSAAQQQVNGFHHDHRNLSPSLATDPYGYSSRLMDHQTQGSSVSVLSQLQRQQQQPSANSNLSNGHWDKWNQGQSVNSLSMPELLRNERMGFNGSLYNNGYEEPKFRIPSPGDVYNRTYGM